MMALARDKQPREGGFLLVNKPRGMTSHDVVAAIRRTLAAGNRQPVSRVGHAGTLDPMATGLLIVGIGSATKALGKTTKLPKTYEAEVTLGATSTTDDAEGAIRAWGMGHGAWNPPTHKDIKNTLEEFRGTTEQVPPAYSAVKIRGVPAYRRARRGESFVLKPRRVTIPEITLVSYEYPVLRIRCTVSSGTYIRALARDIGKRLGTGGYLSWLERTRIGMYRLEDAVPLSGVGTSSLITHLSNH